MCQNNLKIGDDFIIIDYKPTESLKADDNFLVIDWLAEDHFKVDPSDPSVDPTNPNVDLRPMETPGPDDNVGLPAVQTDDGLLLPAVKTGAWIADVTYERAARTRVHEQSQANRARRTRPRCWRVQRHLRSKLPASQPRTRHLYRGPLRVRNRRS